MKTSHKILMFAGIAPMFMVILTVLYVKNILESTGDITVPYNDSYPRVTKEVLVKDFSKISTDGIWRIHVSQGDDFSVELEAPEKAMEDIKIEKTDDTLFLVSRKKSLLKHIIPEGSIYLLTFPRLIIPEVSITQRPSRLVIPQAFITLPSISEIHLHGVTNLDLSGIYSEAIAINAQDVSKISGMDNMFQQLTFTGNGMLFLDMYDTTVTNALINYNGVYDMKMTITGGRLSGHISGIGTLHCKGDVGTNDIEVISPGRMVFSK